MLDVIEKLYKIPVDQIKAPPGYRLTDIFGHPPYGQWYLAVNSYNYSNANALNNGAPSKAHADGKRLFLEKISNDH